MGKYIISIDQSTQGTKGLLFDHEGKLVARCDLSHKQWIDEKGFVEHDPEEIWKNTIEVVKQVVEKAGIAKKDIKGVGISNQRETVMAWDRETGKPIYNAIVWQCSRGKQICREIEEAGKKELVRSRTGMPLSPYFSAAKLNWILENVKGAKEKSQNGLLMCGTMDSWLIYNLTNMQSFKTDFSNASRTQLFNICTLTWDPEICQLFGVNPKCLPEVTDSNGQYGETDFAGFLDQEIPIRAVMGDSHGALFGQGCLQKGMTKATYGTGSSVMMNVGNQPVFSQHGAATSLAWSMDGKVEYVLEGNINYTGAVITWLLKDVQLIDNPAETSQLATEANPQDQTYLVPAFTGLGAPYWDSEATGSLVGITRVTSKAEIVRAGLDCIAYQIGDIVKIMSQDAQVDLKEIRVDGGPTKNAYLMQFQSDVLDVPVQVSQVEELSGMGPAYAAGISLGLYNIETIFENQKRNKYETHMSNEERERRYAGWNKAVKSVLTC